MDTDFIYNPLQDGDLMAEIDRRAGDIVDMAETRVYHNIERALSRSVSYEDVRELAQQAVVAHDIEGRVRDVMMDVLMEIGLIDDDYRAHEPADVDTQALDKIFSGIAEM